MTKTEYTRNNAKADFEVGQTYSNDEGGYRYWKKICKEDGFKVNKKDFEYYFECFAECRGN